MGAIKINGSTSGSTTITAPATGSDETIELSTALASKLPYSYGTATPSTTTSGFLWYDSNSTPAAPKFWDGSAFQPLGEPPASNTNEVTTSQTTTSTSYTDLATVGPSVTITTGTKALVIVSASFFNTGLADAYVSFAVSGASTVSAADKWALVLQGSNNAIVIGASRAYLMTGLTAGSNVFTAKYRVAGTTGTYFNRQITVVDMGS